MDEAHEDVVKFAAVFVIDFFVESRAEAGWVGREVGLDELEGIRPGGGIVESLGTLEMFGAEGSVSGHSGIIIVLFVMFVKCLGTGEDFTGALGANVDVDNLAKLHVS